MNLFYREFKASEPIASGGQWISALGARMAYALGLALYGRLTTPQAWALGILVAGWFATSVVPVTAPLAAVVNAILVGFGAGRLITRLGSIAGKLADGFRMAYSANNEAELESAASVLKAGLDEYALNAISGFVNESTFQAISEQVIKVFPIPDWFSSVLDKGLYAAAFDAKRPVVTGAEWLLALAGRIASAFLDATKYTTLRRELALSASQAWVLGLLLAGWVALSLIPATAALADTLNAILVAVGLIALAGQAAEIGSALSTGLRLAYAARNDEELDRAARALAPAITDSVVVAVELLVSVAAFRAAEALVAKRFPIPDAVAKRVSRARDRGPSKPDQTKPADTVPNREPKKEPVADDGKTKADEKPRDPEKTQERAEEESKRRAEEETRRRAEAERRRAAEDARRVAATAARLEAARRIPEGPDLASIALAGAAIVGVTVSIALLARDRK